MDPRRHTQDFSTDVTIKLPILTWIRDVIAALDDLQRLQTRNENRLPKGEEHHRLNDQERACRTTDKRGENKDSSKMIAMARRSRL